MVCFIPILQRKTPRRKHEDPFENEWIQSLLHMLKRTSSGVGENFHNILRKTLEISVVLIQATVLINITTKLT